MVGHPQIYFVADNRAASVVGEHPTAVSRNIEPRSKGDDARIDRDTFCPDCISAGPGTPLSFWAATFFADAICRSADGEPSGVMACTFCGSGTPVKVW
jgi:hypothetical protein